MSVDRLAFYEILNGLIPMIAYLAMRKIDYQHFIQLKMNFEGWIYKIVTYGLLIDYLQHANGY